MRPVALTIAEAAALFPSPIMCIVACSKYPTILAMTIVMQAALSRCALAIAVGDPLVPLANAPAPAKIAPAFARNGSLRQRPFHCICNLI